MKKIKNKFMMLKIAAAFFIVVAFAAGAFAGFYYIYYISKDICASTASSCAQNQTSSSFDIKSVIGSDYVEITPQINYKTLSFVAGCYALSFDVTEDQALSISNGIEGVIRPRPLQHDIMKEIIDNFNINVLAATIDRYENEIYYSKLLMQGREGILELDVRPSDATALSVRTATPMYIKKSILEEHGSYIC